MRYFNGDAMIISFLCAQLFWISWCHILLIIFYYWIKWRSSYIYPYIIYMYDVSIYLFEVHFYIVRANRITSNLHHHYYSYCKGSVHAQNLSMFVVKRQEGFSGLWQQKIITVVPIQVFFQIHIHTHFLVSSCHRCRHRHWCNNKLRLATSESI